MPREHLVKHDPTRVEVGGGRDLAAALLGGHVRERADRFGAALDCRDRTRLVGQVCDAEITEDDFDARFVGIATEHQVAGLEIAVDDAATMRRRQCAQHLRVTLDRTA